VVTRLNPATYGFGERAGLIMYAGHVVPLFSSNENAAGRVLKTANVTIAAGPRVIFGDQGPITADFTWPAGPVGPVGDAIYNNTFTSDGTRKFTAFVVQFDRPVDPTTFSGDDRHGGVPATR